MTGIWFSFVPAHPEDPLPRLAILLEPGPPLVALGEQVYGRHVHEGFGREDVPEIQRHDVGDQQVDLMNTVGNVLPRLGADVESSAADGAYAVGGFDLHFQQASAGVDDEVVALAVSPGLGDSDVHGGGLDQEGDFG